MTNSASFEGVDVTILGVNVLLVAISLQVGHAAWGPTTEALDAKGSEPKALASDVSPANVAALGPRAPRLAPSAHKLDVPEEAVSGSKVRPDHGIPPTPSPSQLVSILKRKLPADQTLPVQDAPEWFQQLMQRIVRENVPDKYVQEKDWGKTDRRWDGLRVKRRGTLQWSTKRKWKEVNHGTWKRYEVTQIAPEENLTMRIENLRDAGGGKLGFDVRLTSRLHASGRLAKWAKGIQIYNISADADAFVQLHMQCTLAVKLDFGKFPPDVILKPVVTQADLDVQEFQLRKVSKLRGPLVRELSGSVHRALLDRIAEKREKLPQKINRQIAKNQDKLTLSLSSFASERWEALTHSVPRETRQERLTQDPQAEQQMSFTNPDSATVPRTGRATVELKLNSPQLPAPDTPPSDQRPVELLDLIPQSESSHNDRTLKRLEAPSTLTQQAPNGAD